MKRSILVLLGVLLAAVSGPAGEGDKVANFTLSDVNGKEHKLADYSSSKVIVLMFIATECPVSNAYNERMAKLHEDYKEKGVTFLGINSNKQESVEEIIEHAKKNGLEFTILKDHKNAVADRLEASVTPEIYVLNSSLELLYHGRIDDSQREARVTQNDLRIALDLLLSGKTVTTTKTKAFGCTIKRVS